jgi:hypothetical protein
MSVIINLKEIFATDSQVDVSNKVNFNFNQLIALGVGQIGLTGQIGPIGPAGPIGPIGPAGPTGSSIYGTTPATVAPSAPSGVPSGVSIGDILITPDQVLKKVATSISNAYGWEVLTDFNSLVQSALGTNISPYVRLGATAKVVKPRVTAGLDLTNSVTSSDPNYAISGLGTNYQTVLYNFNELKTRSLIISSGSIAGVSNSSGEVSFNASNAAVVDLTNNQITISAGHGLSTGQFINYSDEGGTSIGGLTNNGGYYIYVVSPTVFALCETSAYAIAGTPLINLTSLGNSGTPHKIITYPTGVDQIFPQTSNLSIYSFFNSTASEAKQFETTAGSKGYRGQLELGSLDTLQTAYNGITAQTYLISPSFENLRVRKYRLAYTTPFGDASNPGTYFLRAEYDISSGGSEVPESFSPRRNSEHRWLINKAGTSQSVGRTVEMKLTNEHILADTESTAVAAGVSVDGLFFKRGTSFGGGLENYFGIGFNPLNNNSIDFDAPSGVTFNFNQNIVLGSGVTSTLKSNGIDFASGTSTTWTVTAANGNIKLYTPTATATISLNNAIVVKENRLAQGIPFPIFQVASSDANTLDDYEEGSWSPTLYGGALQNQVTSNPSFKQLMTNTTDPAANSLGGPARALVTPGGPVYEVGLYGPVGSGTTPDIRVIPITVEYARYVKIGKKVTCWVNFTISPQFNWITQKYSGTFASPTYTSVYTAGSNSGRCDFLYNTNGTWMNSCAIGLTLPFGASTAPTAGSASGVSFPDYITDQLSGTVLAGSFNLQIDNNVNDIFYIPSDYPIVQTPAFYYTPTEYSLGAVTGGSVSYAGAVGRTSNSLPINPTGKSEIRIGYVQTSYTIGPGPFFDASVGYAPAALFFGQRDIIGSVAYSSSGTSLNSGATKLSPVTAFDCLYESKIPTSATADSNHQDMLIKFQCHFTYETAT